MVIVDDGSTDGSSEAIASEFPDTIILRGDGNLWWTGSMNMGVEHILSVAENTDFILAINDDVTVEKDYIEKIVAVSKAHDGALVGSMYRDSKQKELIYDSGVKINWKNYSYIQVPYDSEKKVVTYLDVLSTRGVLIPVEVFKRIGVFEKRLRHYAADYEFFMRAKKRGFKLCMSSEAVVYGSEQDKVAEDSSKIQSFRSVWRRTFGIKSPTNIFNHLFIIWHYCPSFRYKLRLLFSVAGYSCFLFVLSALLYPAKLIITRAIGLKKRNI